MRYWPGAQWRKDPSPSTCLLSKLELLGLCVTQGSSCVPSAWVLAGMLAAQWGLFRGSARLPLAGLALCSPCFCPWLLPALGVSPGPACSSPTPCWHCGGSGTAGLVPHNLLDKAASKMAIEDFTCGQGTKTENKPFSCRKPLLGSAENFTVYIKNSIRFPKFKFSK